MYAGFKRIAPEQDTGMVDGARVRFTSACLNSGVDFFWGIISAEVVHKGRAQPYFLHSVVVAS